VNATKVLVTCTGCGSEVPVDYLGIQTSETMVEAVAANAPWCIVCSNRPLFGPRPELEVWGSIPGLT